MNKGCLLPLFFLMSYTSTFANRLFVVNETNDAKRIGVTYKAGSESRYFDAKPKPRYYDNKQRQLEALNCSINFDVDLKNLKEISLIKSGIQSITVRMGSTIEGSISNNISHNPGECLKLTIPKNFPQESLKLEKVDCMRMIGNCSVKQKTFSWF